VIVVLIIGIVTFVPPIGIAIRIEFVR
jgi:hypothetical protein